MKLSQAFVNCPHKVVLLWVHLFVFCSSSPHGAKWVSFFRETSPKNLPKKPPPHNPPREHVGKGSIPIHCVCVYSLATIWLQMTASHMSPLWLVSCFLLCLWLFRDQSDNDASPVASTLAVGDQQCMEEMFRILTVVWRHSAVLIKVGSWPQQTWRVLNTDKESFFKSSSCCISTVQEYCCSRTLFWMIITCTTYTTSLCTLNTCSNWLSSWRNLFEGLVQKQWILIKNKLWQSCYISLTSPTLVKYLLNFLTRILQTFLNILCDLNLLLRIDLNGTQYLCSILTRIHSNIAYIEYITR